MWIPALNGDFLEAYQLYLELNYKLIGLCKLPMEKRTLNWNDLLQEISESKRLSSDQKTGADKAFEYYKQHGTYKEYEYSQNDSNQMN